jgi:hypothetical protein
MKFLTEYKNVTQKVFNSLAVLAALMSERKYVMPQNGDCSKENQGNPDKILKSPCIIHTEI